MNDYIELSGTKVLYPNFDGHKDNFGNVGRRSVLLEVSEQDYYKLKEQGASPVAKKFDDGIFYRLPVILGYRLKDGSKSQYPPKVFRVVVRDGKVFNKRLLDEDTVAILQKDVVLSADAVINLYQNRSGTPRLNEDGEPKRTAYASELYVYVKESMLARKFDDVPDAGMENSSDMNGEDEDILPF